MGTPTPRGPIVDAFLQDAADGILIGGALSSVYHFANGGIEAVRKNVHRIGRMSCKTAGFLGICTAIDYAMVWARGKEDPVLNVAVAVGGASGVMALPKGVRYAGLYALIGGALGGALRADLMRLEDRSPNVSARRKEEPVLGCTVAAGGPSGIMDLRKEVDAGRSALIARALVLRDDRRRNLSPQAQKAAAEPDPDGGDHRAMHPDQPLR